MISASWPVAGDDALIHVNGDLEMTPLPRWLAWQLIIFLTIGSRNAQTLTTIAKQIAFDQLNLMFLIWFSLF